MKVLLAGFSRQNAAALQYLIDARKKSYEVVDMELSFNQELQLCLPNIPDHHHDATAVIVNVSGVGLAHRLTERVRELKDFIGNRVAILVAQATQEVQQTIETLQSNLTFFVNFPYSKESMEQALDKLFFAVPLLVKKEHLTREAEESPKPVAPTPPPTLTQKIAQSLTPSLGLAKAGTTATESSKASLLAQFKTECKENRPAHFIHRLLDVHFNIQEISLLHRFADVIAEECPLELTIGTQVIYIHRFQNLALVANHNRLMDYCAIASDFEVFSDVIKVKTIDFDDFEKVANAPYTPYKKHSLNTLLWQMGHRMLPKTVDVPDHPLRLKMRFMPSFLGTEETPEYMRALTSVCLLAPRSLDELTVKMAGVADKGVINRLFLLAILSGMADMEVLEKSLSGNHTQTSDRIQNRGVTQAKQTGFLKRFLNKLGF